MKPQTPGRGFFYALMMEEAGNFSSGCPGLYTQIFRIRAGSWSGAYTVYSKIQGSDRFLLAGVYRKLENPGPRAESVYSNFPGPGRFLIDSVYSKLEKPGPGRNLYTQKFRAQAGSWSGAYTKSSKSPGLGRISILKFSGLGQVPSPGRIQKAQKIQSPGRLQID